MIEVLAPGARTSIQDLGRGGHRAIGVGPSGAFDAIAARAANLAVGNPPEAAVLEATLFGPTVRAGTAAVVAIAGATGEVTPRTLAAGEVLEVGRIERGVRAYVAVRGGIAVDPVLGSRSTHLASELGPESPRAGDRLPIGDAATTDPRACTIPTRDLGTIRILDLPEALADGFSCIVDPRSDRTGVRLRPEQPLPLEGGDLDPEPLLPGTIQLPRSGQPIVLGPDGPTTGGYRVIGTVVRADLGVLAQAKPGQRLRAIGCDQETAVAAWKNVCTWLDRSI